jgi:hypothetical protein
LQICETGRWRSSPAGRRGPGTRQPLHWQFATHGGWTPRKSLTQRSSATSEAVEHEAGQGGRTRAAWLAMHSKASPPSTSHSYVAPGEATVARHSFPTVLRCVGRASRSRRRATRGHRRRRDAFQRPKMSARVYLRRLKWSKSTVIPFVSGWL